MTSALEAMAAVAATKRLTTLIVDDEITRPLREAIVGRWPGSRAAYLVTCPKCVSVWAGAAIAASPKSVRWTLALSSGTMLVGWLADMTEYSIAERGRRG